MKHFCPDCGMELDENQILCPKCNCNSAYVLMTAPIGTVGSGLSAIQLENNTQWLKYKCGVNGSTGHGFAAEDKALQDDMWHFRDANPTGRNNQANGADRTVGDLQIQMKYCQTAKSSVNSAFDSNGNGLYRYLDADTGKPMVLEVPKDQYEAAVEMMKNKIANGQVPGVSDPNEASKLVKEGCCTYRQAKNLAKAGNIDSLIFDAKNHAVVALSAFGISFAVNLAMLIAGGIKTKRDFDDAVKTAVLAGLKNGTITLTSGILSSQILRTTLGRNMAAALTSDLRNGLTAALQTDTGKTLINNMAKTISGNAIHGAAARNVVVKYLRTNIITNLALTAVLSFPDTINSIAGKMSGKQFVKNLVVNVDSLGGATIGFAVGSLLGPWGATAGTIIGGFGGGWATKKIADKICRDDSDKMCDLVRLAMLQLSNDYLIASDAEFQRCIDMITADGAISSDLLKLMYSVGDDKNDVIRVQLAYSRLEYYFSIVLRERKTLQLQNNQQIVLDNIEELGNSLIRNS